MVGRRWAGHVAVMGVVAFGAAGCGGDGGASEEEFATEANAICQKHRATIEAAASEVLAGGQLPDPQEFGQLAQGTVIPELSAQFDELRDVEAAPDAAEAFEAYLDQGEQAVDAIRENPAALTDPANFTSVNAQADAAGLSDACHLGPE